MRRVNAVAVNVEAVQHVLDQGKMQQGESASAPAARSWRSRMACIAAISSVPVPQAGSIILSSASAFASDQFTMSSVSASLASSMAENVVRVEGAVVLRRGEKPVIERACMVEAERG